MSERKRKTVMKRKDEDIDGRTSRRNREEENEGNDKMNEGKEGKEVNEGRKMK